MDLSNKILQSLSKSKIIHHERKGSYILDTKICSAESFNLEFKNYSWPFSQDLNFTLLKAICGFLNRSGGTILIGVNDDRVVKGITIQNIDQLKLHFDNLKRRFYPLPQGFIKIMEIPIKKYVGESQEKYTWLPNIYIIRIEVSQGYLDKLYTFKFQKDQQQETLYSSFREDASLVTIDSFDKIYEKIYQKAICPENKAKIIIYDQPDQEGLQESQNQNQQQQPQEHNIKHQYIAFTNIFKDKMDQFQQYLEDNLNQLNVQKYEVVLVSEYIIIIKSKKINKVKEALNQFIMNNNQILTFTYKQQPLQFGFINNIITLKGIQKNDIDFIKLTHQLNFEHRFKENGDLIIYTSKNMRIVPQFYSECKFEKIQIFIKFE
ncbi:hypothetical protein ABPG72_003700 [Tetrahymena utriculariae]